MSVSFVRFVTAIPKWGLRDPTSTARVARSAEQRIAQGVREVSAIPGIGGWNEVIDGESVTVIEYKDQRVYVRDTNSMTAILREHTDMQIKAGIRDANGRMMPAADSTGGDG